MELSVLSDDRRSPLPTVPLTLPQRGVRSSLRVSRDGTPCQRIPWCLAAWPRCWLSDTRWRQTQRTIVCSRSCRSQRACSLRRSRVKQYFHFVCWKHTPEERNNNAGEIGLCQQRNVCDCGYVCLYGLLCSVAKDLLNFISCFLFTTDVARAKSEYCRQWNRWNKYTNNKRRIKFGLQRRERLMNHLLGASHMNAFENIWKRMKTHIFWCIVDYGPHKNNQENW